MNPRECFWFGTVEKSAFIATPLRGADSTPASWGVNGTLLNGGGYSTHAWNSHKTYTYEWPSTSSPQMAQLMKSYRDGTYGRGLLYFLDPQIYTTNILPARWADPSMALDYEAPSLIPGVDPTAVATADAAENNLPITSSVYNITSPAVVSGYGPGAVFVPIPDGHTLFMSAFHSFTGTGGLFVTPVNQDGSFATQVKLTALANNTTNLGADRFSGYKGVYLWGGRTTGATSTLTVAAIVARLLKTSDVPVYTPWVTQAENLFTNPSFEAGSGSVEVRRNRSTNPAFRTGETGWNNWAPGTGMTGVTSRPLTGGIDDEPFRRWTITTPGTGAMSTSAALSNDPGDLPEGTVVTLSIYVRSSKAVPVLLQAQSYTRSSSTLVGPSNGATVTLAPNVWTRISVTAPVLPTATTVRAALYVQANSLLAAGDTFDMVRYLSEVSPVLGDYFDGSTVGDQVQPEDFRTRWLGAENASESVLEIERVRGFTGVRCIGGVSTKNGKPAIRQIATDPVSGDSYLQAVAVIPATARGLGTLIASSHLDEPQVGNSKGAIMTALPDVRIRRPNDVAGSIDLRQVYGPLSSPYLWRLLHGGAQGSGDVWWTDVGLFEGTYTGPWFDGSTPNPSDTEQYLWSGTPDNSTSLYQTRTRLSGNVGKLNAIESGPWIGGQGHSGARFSGMPPYVNNGPINGGQIGFAASFIETGDLEGY